MTQQYEPEVFHTKLVGVTFEGRQQVLQAIERLQKENTQVELLIRREYDNQYDPNAIAVDAKYYDYTFLSEVTRQIGYIKKELAEVLAEDIEEGYDFDVLEFDITGEYRNTKGINIKLLRREANMAKKTALQLLAESKKRGGGASFLRLLAGTTLKLRFLKGLEDAAIKITHSIKMPDTGKYERFACLKCKSGTYDESIECPLCTIDDRPWTKLSLPVIDRNDVDGEHPGGKVKLFEETLAVFRLLEVMEQDPANDAEKMFKLGGLTNADIIITQQGTGKERKVTPFPDSSTIRPLNDAEKALRDTAPNAMIGMKFMTVQELEQIVARYNASHTQAGDAAPQMGIQQPADPFNKAS